MANGSFIGNVLNAVDAKNRVSIPAGFRDALAQRSEVRGVLIAPAERADCLVGYDSGYLDRIEAELESRFAGDYSDARDDVWREAFGFAEPCGLDDNGRIILSREMKDAGGIDRLALFVGVGKTFEIWNPQRFIARDGIDPRRIAFVQAKLDARGEA